MANIKEFSTGVLRGVLSEVGREYDVSHTYVKKCWEKKSLNPFQRQIKETLIKRIDERLHTKKMDLITDIIAKEKTEWIRNENI